MYIKNLLLFTFLLVSLSTHAQLTRVQFINNCADLSFDALDVYVNDIANEPPEVDDLNFRTATAFFDLPAGTQLEIGIASRHSFDVNDTFFRQVITLNTTNFYIFVLNGIESTSGYTPQTPFKMDIYTLAKEATNIGETDFLFMNGATDATIMDMRTGTTTLADNINTSTFNNGYRKLQSNTDYKLRLTNTTGSKITHTFNFPLSTMSLSGSAVTILTSGFINPAVNSNGPDFGLWMARPTGGPLTELDSTSAEALARIQLIHNSADTSVGKVDVYVNGEKIVDSIDFHNATTYMDAIANTTHSWGLAHPGSGTPFFNMNINLDSGKTYSAVLNGIESDTNYVPLEPLTIHLYNSAREESSVNGNTDLLLMHGCTDAKSSSVKDISSTAITPFTNLNYGDFSNGYYSINAPNVLMVDTIGNPLENYEINLGSLNISNKPATIVYSGFITPDSNSGGPSFELWLATPEGGAMTKIPIYVSVNDITTKAQQIQLYPNPATSIIRFNLEGNADVIITDITGKVVWQQNNYSVNSINLQQLSIGNYILLLQQEGNIYYSKFTKQ